MKYARLFLIMIIVWLSCELAFGTTWYAQEDGDLSTITWSSDDFENMQLEEITNGDFGTGDLTGWAVTVTGWHYDGGGVTSDFATQADATKNIKQDAANTPLTLGDVYRLEYEVLAVT